MRGTAKTMLVCCLLLAMCFATAQTHVIDSLRNKMWVESNPAAKLQLLITLCEQHQSINKDSLYQYALLAQDLSQREKNKKNKALADLILINSYLRIGNTDSAMELTDAGLLTNTLNNPDSRDIYFKLTALKADCYGDASDYKNALSTLYRLVGEAEPLHDSLVLAKNMSTIGVINYNLDHVPDAFSWYFRGLSYITDDPRYNAAAAVLYINLAETYRWMQQTDSAEYYINKAIPRCRQIENLFFLANAARIQANIYKEKKQYDLAEKTMMECIQIRERTEGKLILSNEQLALAGIFMHSGKTDSAIAILTNALLKYDSTIKSDRQYQKKGNEADAMKIAYYQNLAKCYQLKGDAANYQQMLEKIIAAKDAFYEANSARAIAELQTKYETQKKESTIIKQKLAITQKNYLFYGLLIILSLLLALFWLLFKNYERRQAQKMKMAIEEEKRIAAESILDAEEQERRRIAADLHDNIGAYASAIHADVEKISDHGIEKNAIALQNLQQHSKEIINSLRDTIWVLNKDTITITGISDRIKTYISKLRPSYGGIMISVNEEIKNDMRISSRNALNIFRIVQEALHNALKHSGASIITVFIKSNTSIDIKIEDNGKGMNGETNHTEGNGLLNMKARAVEANMLLEIESQVGVGTALLLRLTTN
ncbi:MAG: hypothetical protein JST75_14205 [Bacteroidetes bacterium]|nr:hypothetical protein [Bacteroidota bacterium]